MTEQQLKEIEDVASGGAYHGAEEDVVALGAEVRRLRAALKVYANHYNWHIPTQCSWVNTDFCDPRDGDNDGWKLAEEALKDE